MRHVKRPRTFFPRTIHLLRRLSSRLSSFRPYRNIPYIVCYNHDNSYNTHNNINHANGEIADSFRTVTNDHRHHLGHLGNTQYHLWYIVIIGCLFLYNGEKDVLLVQGHEGVYVTYYGQYFHYQCMSTSIDNFYAGRDFLHVRFHTITYFRIGKKKYLSYSHQPTTNVYHQWAVT